MKPKNYYLIIAGIICLATALLHTIGGQYDLIGPLLDSDLHRQKKTELLGVWHMVTVIIFISAIVLLKNGFRPNSAPDNSISLLAWLFIAFGIVFLMVSIFNQTLAPQWILCFPIGVLALLGNKKLLQSINH